MFSFFKSKVEFITTPKINFYIESIIDKAEEFIYIVTPFIKINMRLNELLRMKREQGIPVYLICRKDSMEQAEVNDLFSQVYDRKTLHAKAILSEKSCIVTSMNLYEFSQVNNDEMGFYLERTIFSDAYNSVLAEIKKILSQCPNKFRQKQNNENSFNTVPNRANHNFVVGTTYNIDEISKQHGIKQKLGGIRVSEHGDVFVFTYKKSTYPNEIKGQITFLNGQKCNNGELKYNNEKLYKAYQNKQLIYYFIDNVYQGQYIICQQPYTNDSKQWIFPIKKQ